MAFFQLQTLVAGNHVVVTYVVRDQRATPPIPMDPSDDVTLSLRQPDGVLVLTDVVMVKTKVGYYNYGYQTLITSQEGVWMARAKTNHQGVENLSDWEPVFNLKSPA